MALFIVFVLTGVMLIVFGIVIRFKKTYMIISGINASTPERRANMDLDAICNVVGNVLMVGGLMWIAAGLLYLLGIILAILVLIPVFILWVLGAFVYIQRYDRNNRDESGKIKRRAKIVYVIAGIVSIAVCVFIGILIFSGVKAPVFTIQGDVMNIESSFGCEISKKDITSLTLTDTLPPLSRTNGYGMGTYLKGAVQNRDLGAGRAYVKTDNPPFIFLELGGSDAKFLYVNLYSREKTEELYAQLSKWLA